MGLYKRGVVKSLAVQIRGCTKRVMWKRGLRKGCCERRVLKQTRGVIQKGSSENGGVQKGSCVNGAASPSHCH